MNKKSLFLSSLTVLSVLTVSPTLALGPLKTNLKFVGQHKNLEEQAGASATPLTREDI